MLLPTNPYILDKKLFARWQHAVMPPYASITPATQVAFPCRYKDVVNRVWPLQVTLSPMSQTVQLSDL